MAKDNWVLSVEIDEVTDPPVPSCPLQVAKVGWWQASKWISSKQSSEVSKLPSFRNVTISKGPE